MTKRIAYTSKTTATLKKDSRCRYYDVVERWIPGVWPPRRRDHCTVIDVLAYFPGYTLAIQSTSAAMHSTRIFKAIHAKELRAYFNGAPPGVHRFEVWSWGLRGARGKRKLWQVRRQRLRLSDLRAVDLLKYFI